MRLLTERLVMLMTLTFVALAVSQGEPSTLLIAGLLAVAIAAVVVARYASTAVVGHTVSVSDRAREHRAGLLEIPAPRHPNTAGRPRTRAPSRAALAA